IPYRGRGPGTPAARSAGRGRGRPGIVEDVGDLAVAGSGRAHLEDPDTHGALGGLDHAHGVESAPALEHRGVVIAEAYAVRDVARSGPAKERVMRPLLRSAALVTGGQGIAHRLHFAQLVVDADPLPGEVAVNLDARLLDPLHD